MNSIKTMSYKDKLNSLDYSEFLLIRDALLDSKSNVKRILKIYDSSDEIHSSYVEDLDNISNLIGKLSD